MNLHFFTAHQIMVLIISFIFIISSVTTFVYNKKTIAIWLLFFGAISIGFFIAMLDPFLILWDEQYHALVAKNMIQNPLKPTLYKTPILDFDYKNWTGNNIWLHKQPLFLWQIAMCIKLFGVNTLAVRIPNILMHAITTILIFRIGEIITNKTIGFYAAIFFVVANYFLELVAGKIATDHNDVAFLFYITASFWAWFEYKTTHKKLFIVLVGLLAGFAVLTKWLVGLIVFVPWLATIFMQDEKHVISFKLFKDFVVSLLLSILTFVPWQLYILHHYPREAKYEFALNTQHFYKAVENQGGNIWFHFNALKNIYGSYFLMPFLLVLGIFVLLKLISNNSFKISIIVSIVTTYAFYSVAATKMISFCTIVSPFLFLGFGALISEIINFVSQKIKKQMVNLFTIITLLIVCFSFLNINSILHQHTNYKLQNTGRKAELATIKLIDKLNQNLQGKKFVVFNVNTRLNAHISVMFYTNYVAYDFIPSAMQIAIAKKTNHMLAIIDNNHLPQYIIGDKEIVLIK